MNQNIKEVLEKAYSLGYVIKDFTKFNNALMDYSGNIDDMFNKLFDLEEKMNVTFNYTDFEELLSSYLKSIEMALSIDSMYAFTSPLVRSDISNIILKIRKKYIVSITAKKAIEEYNNKSKELGKIISDIDKLSSRDDLDSMQKALLYLELYGNEEKIKQELEILENKAKSERQNFVSFQNNADLNEIKKELEEENRSLIASISKLILSKNTVDKVKELSLNFENGFIKGYGSDVLEVTIEYQKLLSEFGLDKKDVKEAKLNKEEVLVEEKEGNVPVIFTPDRLSDEKPIYTVDEIASEVNNYGEDETSKEPNKYSVDEIVSEVSLNAPKYDIDEIIEEVNSYGEDETSKEPHKYTVDEIVSEVNLNNPKHDIDEIIREVNNYGKDELINKEPKEEVTPKKEADLIPQKFKVIFKREEKDKRKKKGAHLAAVTGLVKHSKSLDIIKRAAIKCFNNVSNYINKLKIQHFESTGKSLLKMIEDIFKSEESFEDIEGLKSDYVVLKQTIESIKEEMNNQHVIRGMR